MKLHTKPKVYIVGQTEIYAVLDTPADEGEGGKCPLDHFLADHEVSHWETDSDVGGEIAVEVAGRLCYMSFAKPRPGGNAAYIQHIKESGHGSVLEHPVWQFIICGVSRSFTHELVRHRAGWGYSQLSQRYVDESVCEVVVPLELQYEVAQAEAYMRARTAEVITGFSVVPQTLASFSQLKQIEIVFTRKEAGHYLWQFDKNVEVGLRWLRNMLRNNDDYQYLTAHLSSKITSRDYAAFVQAAEQMGNGHAVCSPEDWLKGQSQEYKTGVRKGARQAGRSVLPNATETKIFCTANARALRHFIEMRGSKFAEPEIRMAAIDLLRQLQVRAPNLFGDYQIVPLGDGTFEAQTKYRKV